MGGSGWIEDYSDNTISLLIRSFSVPCVFDPDYIFGLNQPETQQAGKDVAKKLGYDEVRKSPSICNRVYGTEVRAMCLVV